MNLNLCFIVSKISPRYAKVLIHKKKEEEKKKKMKDQKQCPLKFISGNK